MDYVTAAGAIRSRAQPRWRQGVRRGAAALGLVAADIASFALTFLLLRFHHAMPAVVLFSGRSVPTTADSLDIFLLSGTVFVAVRLLLGDYSRRQIFWENARATSITLALLALIDLGLAAIIGWRSLTLALASWVLIALAIPLMRQAARRALTAIGLWQIPAALLGSGPNASEAYAALGRSLALGFDIRYIIQSADDDEVPPDLAHLTRIPFENPNAVNSALNQTECAQIVIAAGYTSSPEIGDFIQRAIAARLGVMIIPALRGLPLFGLQTNYFFGNDMLLLQVRNNLTRFPSRVIKRVTDIVGSTVLMIVLSPVLLLIALAVKLDSPGPAIFAQDRLGRDARLFSCLKFRSMAINAEDRLAAWRKEQPELYEEYIRSNFKLREDPRVTRVGRWLRRYSLDELPQLVNVLMGSMSLVGPRPLLARELPDYGPTIDLYCNVRPGITGLWQTSGRSDTHFRDRVVLDEWYILNWSYWYDIVILLQTIRIVAMSKGAF